MNIGASPNASELSFTLPNGSIIYLSGADAKPDEMNKLLGQKYKLVIVDEAAFFRQDMSKLVYEILKPAVADYNGTIALISTTSSFTSSLYYKIANGLEAGWEVFKWTASDNPFMKDKWQKEIDFLTKNKPGIEETPSFKRMYLNEWYIDEDDKVYKYDPFRNFIKELPKADYSYMLGIDLGYDDATAMVVVAFSEHDPNLYAVETFSRSKMTVSEAAEQIRRLDAKYNFEQMIVDNASKQSVEEIKKRYQLPLIAAEKTSKREYIEMLNSDLLTSNIKLTPGASALKDEWSKLTWDETKKEQGKYVEHPGLPNHLSDAFLYAWRWAHNYANTPKVSIPPRNSEAAVDMFWEQEEEKMTGTSEWI